MEHKMLWGAFAVGSAGWLFLLLLASRGTRPTPDSSSPHHDHGASSAFVGLALALPVLVWLATLPTKAPFSSGQGWGRGFLLGGLIAFISAFVVSRSPQGEGRHLALVSLFGAFVVACVPLLWMRHAVIEALLGAALGWCVVALVWLCAPQAKSDSPERGAASSLSLGLLNGAAFVTALCSVAALGVYRDFSVAEVARGTHSAVALVLAAGVALALLFGVLLDEAGRGEGDTPSSLPRLFQLLTALLCFAVPIGLGFFLATRVLDDLKVLYCLGIGATLGLLGWGLLWEASHREDRAASQTTIPPVAILVALCAFMLAYSFLQGFGVGLMLLAAWPVSLLLWAPTGREHDDRLRLDVAQTASLLGAFLAVLLVSRVFATRFRADLRGVGLVDQFALFGFLAGAIVPTWLASLWFGNKGKEANIHPVASLLQLAAMGIFALLLPSAMLAIWGVKIMPALFAGMGLAIVGWGATTEPPARICAIALFAQALSLVITQWTLRFLPLAEVSRSQRMHFLLWGLGGAVVLVLLVDLSARLLILLQKRGRFGTNEPSQGVSP